MEGTIFFFYVKVYLKLVEIICYIVNGIVVSRVFIIDENVFIV